LSHGELVEAQAETLALPRRSYGLAARALFATLDACYGKPHTLSKFKVLELVARVPYRAWELVGAGVGRLRQRLLDSSAGHRYLVLDLPRWTGSTPPAWARHQRGRRRPRTLIWPTCSPATAWSVGSC